MGSKGSKTGGSSGIIFPLYVYPTPDEIERTWTKVALASHIVPVIAVVNPNSGPGSTTLPDASYVAAITTMRQRGHPVNLKLVGYVPLTFGKRPFAQVVEDIRVYSGWNELSNGTLALDGIFFDEMPASSDSQQPYPHAGDFGGRPHVISSFTQSATAIARTLSCKGGSRALLVTNPGVVDIPAREYARTFGGDVTVAFETSEGDWSSKNVKETATFLADNTEESRRHAVSVIIHTADVKSLPKLVRQLRSVGVDYVLISDRQMPNPYDGLPKYWDDFVQLLAA
ncbi:hypothetical protein HDU93_006808 [Gonapodya sp. JEL0774]|nr:hypothetical protein HDU93_006808 [Gonapodya sp. JEL0774]